MWHMKKFVWIALLFNLQSIVDFCYNKIFCHGITENSFLQSQLKISLIRLNHCIIIISWLNIWNEPKKGLWNAHLSNTFTYGWNWIYEIIALYFTWYLLITTFCRAYALNFLFLLLHICILVGIMIILWPGHFHFLQFFHIFLVIWWRAFWHSLFENAWKLYHYLFTFWLVLITGYKTKTKNIWKVPWPF